MSGTLPWSGALAAVCWAAAALVAKQVPPPPLPLYERPPLNEYLVLDTTHALLGLRRWGADMAFIQLLQYYGRFSTHSHAEGEGHPPEEIDPTQFEFHGVLPYTLRAVGLDPNFYYATLFGASALAFNLGRPEEAEQLLDRAIRWDPQFWQFHLYAGAISFQKTKNVDKIAPLLEKALQYPDCPSLVVNILGNLYKMKGDIPNAVRVFRWMRDHSRDANYAALAEMKLRSLEVVK